MEKIKTPEEQENFECEKRDYPFSLNDLRAIAYNARQIHKHQKRKTDIAFNTIWLDTIIQICKQTSQFPPKEMTEIKPITDHDLLILADGYLATTDNLKANATSYVVGYRYAERMLLSLLNSKDLKEEPKQEEGNSKKRKKAWG